MPPMDKTSVSIDSEDLAWAKKRARKRTTSLSAVVSEALRRERQAEARAKLLKDLGTDDIASEVVAALRAEIRGNATERTAHATRAKRIRPA